VVAEGAEEGLINEGEHITKELKHDASGNKIFDDIGEVLSAEISKYARSQHNMDFNVSYIDPTYAIRSVPANSGDCLLCSRLAQNAVHGVMYGFQGFSTGSVRNSICYIPLTTMILAKTNRVSVRSRPWLRLVAVNDQPCFVNDEHKQLAEETIQKKENEIIERYERIKTRIEKKNHGLLVEPVTIDKIE
jgi:6-phosphofructokinase 1